MPCSGDTYRLRHPLVGELTVTQQGLHVAHSLEQSVVAVITEPESSAQDTIQLLTRLTQW